MAMMQKRKEDIENMLRSKAEQLLKDREVRKIFVIIISSLILNIGRLAQSVEHSPCN